ncbi:olfactory receptor 2K2-like [Ambystoma mexicanum]|uniref:olfactory receptor 2K2-like n=1 Tax=Ambystoma mexicanum TaxID=8296 RepID=UPI0037E7B857
MESGNQSLLKDFILLGFSVSPQIKIVLFVVFLTIYLVTLIANSLIITVVRGDSRLHSPMYFFICNLSFIDLCYASTNVPTCLQGFLSERNTITFVGCVSQMFFGLSFGATQCMLLAVMAWDRYVAICNPLNYQLIMNRSVCSRLTIATWAVGFLNAIVHVSFTMTTPFCGRNKINHAVCELAAVLRLACVDTRLIEAVIFVVSIIVLVAPLSLIIFTYIHIISTILRMPTSTGRHKAFSTCGSHLTVVSLFYGTAIAIYMSPRSLISRENEKYISLIYGLVTPALNPLIYTLRNKEVKGSMKKLLTGTQPAEY